MLFTRSTRRLGIISALGITCLSVAYAVTLTIGLTLLPSPAEPIGDPYFSVLEVLICSMMPLFVALFVAVHAWSPACARAFTSIAVVFSGLLAGLTMSVHFVILNVNREAAFANLASAPLLISFRWPSMAYMLDILAWDVFFALAVLFAQLAFSGSRLAAWVRVLMIVSGALALAGLSGVIADNMQLRNIGVLGYVGVFPVATALLARLFWVTAPAEKTDA